MLKLCILLLLFTNSVSPGNILVLNPTNGHSHVKLLGNIADLLANDGHNVTVLSAVIDPKIKPFGTTNPKINQILHNSPYLQAQFMDDLDMKSELFWASPDFDGMTISWSDWQSYMGVFQLMYKGILEDKALLQTLKDSNFDLGVSEIYELGTVGLLEILNIKSHMVATSVGMIQYHYGITGIPLLPSFTPDWMTTYDENMSFRERFITLKANIEFYLQNRRDIDNFNQIFREFYPEMPDLYELAKAKTGVILSNANEFTESARLRSNMIQYIGGANVHPVKPLEKEISDILNLRPKNVYFSFGTFANVCNMPVALKNEILSAFAVFPNVTFLWKHEDCPNGKTPIPELPNVIRKEWWPQSDMLGDSRLNAFITHGGMNSIIETAFRGTPTITVPLFGDQYGNAKTIVNRGMSIMIKRTELNKKTLVAALTKILEENSAVAHKAKLAAAVLKGKDEEYRQSVLRWAIEFGPLEHLILPSRNLNFLQMFSLDILGCVVALFSFGVILVLFSCRAVFCKRSEKFKKL